MCEDISLLLTARSIRKHRPLDDHIYHLRLIHINHFWSNTTQHVLHTTILYLQQHLRFGTSVQQIAVTGRYVTVSISALLRNLIELWVPKKQWYTPLSIEKQEILSWAALLHTWTLSSHIWIIFDKSHVISGALALF